MGDFDINIFRNIGIAAHIDAGKTTITERILYYTGASYRIGEVHEGAAHMDYMAEEQAHGITITTAVTRCPWNDHLIQVVDTPGHVDFTIEVERAMRILDGAVIVMDGVRGVEPQTETVWRQASKFDIPRLIFINKMDRPGASYERSMEMLEKKLHGHPVPVCVPIVEENAIIDLINQQLLRFSGDQGQDVSVEPIPDEHAEIAQIHRETLLLAAAEVDPDLEDDVLEDNPIEPQRVWSALRKATLQGKANPVFAGSALRNWGIQPLLDAVIHLLPAPLDRPESIAVDSDENEHIIEMTPSGGVVALAFKVQMWEGRRHVFARIYRGKVTPGMKLSVSGRDIEERVARVFDIDAGSKTRLTEATAGQIVLLAGLRRATTGDTLCTPGEELLLEAIDARNPVLGLAIETESSRDEQKLLDAIAKICEEDPTLRFEEDPETGQRILSGMGELHLQIIFERLQREHKLSVRAGKPRVMTRETVAANGTGTANINRVLATGDNEIVLRARACAQVQPRARGTGIETTIDPKVLPDGATLSPIQHQSLVDGVNDALHGGPVEGADLQDVAVQLTEVEVFDNASSSPQALRITASQAVRDALIKAGGQVLRPLMRVEVVVPDESMGTVLGDLQSRKATITGQSSDMGSSTILGECPLNELLGYTTRLRSLTRGRGQFTMEFMRFDVG